jgi:hypothetical protein
MPQSMPNNKNAEKWTLEEAESFCNEVLKILEENPKVRTLGKACLMAGKYEQIIGYLEDKFQTVFTSIKKAREIAKERLIESALENDVNTTMAIFILKNNHGLKDRQDIDHTTKDKEINEVTFKII